MGMTIRIAAMLVLLVFLAGCAQKGAEIAGTDRDVASVSDEISSIDEDAANIDTSDLDTLEQELAAIENIEIE